MGTSLEERCYIPCSQRKDGISLCFFFYFLQRKMTQVLFLCVFIMYLSWQMADYLDPGSTPRFLLYVAAQHFMGEYWVSVNKKLNEK